MRAYPIGLALGLGLGAAAFADDGQRFRLQAGYVTAPTELYTSLETTLGMNGAFGVRLSFEHLFNRHFGLEAGVATSDHPVTISFSSNGTRRETSFRMTPLTLFANYHFGDSDRADPYFGGGAAYVFSSDAVPVGGGEPVSVDPELTWTVQYGIDIVLGRRELFQPLPQKWKLGISVAYLPDDAVQVGRTAIPIESFHVYAGVTLRLN